MSDNTATSDAPRFHTPAGEIIGWRDGNVIRATGIPYAHTQRFRPPQPLPPATQPIDARQWAPACPQRPPLKSRAARLQQRQHDLLIGTNRDEAALFLHAVPRLEGFFRLPWLGPAVYRALNAAITGGIYARPAERLARQYAASGGRSYLYELHWCSGRTRRGACHTIDLPLLFAGRSQWRRAAIVDGLDEAELDDCGRRTRAPWARFARSGHQAVPGCLRKLRQWQGRDAFRETRAAFFDLFTRLRAEKVIP